jgi:hypothetical protein
MRLDLIIVKKIIYNPAIDGHGQGRCTNFVRVHKYRVSANHSFHATTGRPNHKYYEEKEEVMDLT